MRYPNLTFHGAEAIRLGGLAPPKLRNAEVNEFYQKGCQEKTSASTGVEVLFLETQPTFHRLRCSGFAF